MEVVKLPTASLVHTLHTKHCSSSVQLWCTVPGHFECERRWFGQNHFRQRWFFSYYWRLGKVRARSMREKSWHVRYRTTWTCVPNTTCCSACRNCYHSSSLFLAKMHFLAVVRPWKAILHLLTSAESSYQIRFAEVRSSCALARCTVQLRPSRATLRASAGRKGHFRGPTSDQGPQSLIGTFKSALHKMNAFQRK